MVIKESIYYLLGENIPCDGHFENLQAAQSWGFKISDCTKKVTTLQEIYDFIESELLTCIPQLTNDVRYGSMTRPVAYALLAKLYLNAERYAGEPQWEKCAAYCDSIINGGYGYMLDNNYFNVFKTTNTNNPEIIFPIVFDAKYAKGNMLHLITLPKVI